MSYLRKGFGAAGDPFLPSVAYVTDGGLVLVRPDAIPALQKIFGVMAFDTKSEVDPIMGEARLSVMPPTKSAWAVIDDFVRGGGYAALLDKSTVPSDVAHLVFTQSPELVASMANATGTHALILPEPKELLDHARLVMGGAALPPGAAPPVDKASAAGGIPSWAWLVGGAAVLAALAFGRKR